MHSSVIEYYDEQTMFHGSMNLIMGTSFDMILIGKPREEAEDLWQRSIDELSHIECLVNRFNPSSEVADLNRSEPLSYRYVSSELKDMIVLADAYRGLTEGLFDITLGGSPFPGFAADGALCISNGGCHLDFGGFAKGYAMRRVNKILDENSVKSAFVDFGNSSILAVGSHPCGDFWWVSVPDPFTGREIYQFRMRDCSLSISGNTPVYNTHIVNPQSGRWESRKRVSAVMTADPLDAEILSTTWMIASSRQRCEIASRFDIKDEFVYTDQE